MSELISAERDNINAILLTVWALFTRGVTDRRSVFHTPTIATVEQGEPALRTVVLRAADAERRVLSFHTDQRSAKVAALIAQPVASLHVYDAELKMQVRATGPVTLHADDATAEAAWAGSSASAQRCYAVVPGPGSVIATPDEADLDGQPATAARAVFLRADLLIKRLEWLHLAATGHRRARFTWTETGLSSCWLVP